MSGAKPRRGRRSVSARLVSLGSLLLLVMIAACATQRPGDPTLYRPDDPAPAVVAYVSYNGFHSDLSLPTAWLARGQGPSARAVARLKPEPWTAVGWGDRSFYQGQGLGAGRLLDLLRAAVWPVNASVVHLAGERDPTAPVPGWRTLRLGLSQDGAERLRRRLDQSFALKDGAPQALGGDAGALFFASRENANALHVCNHWTAELLNAAGAPITPLLDLTTFGMAADLRWRAHAMPVIAGR